jgi:hypothetical protein
MLRRACLVALMSACLPAVAWAQPPQVLCKTSGPNYGPCKSPDSLDVLLRQSNSDLVMAANFGLLYSVPETPGTYQFVCEEIFGGRLADRTQIAKDGRIFVPALDGLYFSTDGCVWTKATGSIAGQSVWDIAFDPTTPSTVWAISGDTRHLSLSTDGGASFVDKYTFPDQLRFIRMLIAPSDPRIMYLGGYRSRMPLVLAVSQDGGATWTINDSASMGVADMQQTVDIQGVSPDDPKQLYFSVTNPNGDEVWRFESFGTMPVKVQTLLDGGELRGFTFGPNANTLYLASFDPLDTVGKPPSTLWSTHDRGKTWQSLPQPGTGPRFRCLRWRDNKLFACGGDAINGDQFLLGSSSDEGKTWTPSVKFTDIRGVKACVSQQCVITASWLCDSYGACANVAPSPTDGGVPSHNDAGPPICQGSNCRKSGWCSIGGRSGSNGALLALAVTLGLLGRRRRRREGA